MLPKGAVEKRMVYVLAGTRAPPVVAPLSPSPPSPPEHTVSSSLAEEWDIDMEVDMEMEIEMERAMECGMGGPELVSAGSSPSQHAPTERACIALRVARTLAPPLASDGALARAAMRRLHAG